MAEKHGGKIDRYRIIAPIGSGGFATVFRAVDERLGSEVALKVLADNHSLVPDSRERFISEAQHLRRVDSYWVASIFDLGETETGQPYMVLELADRGDLETRVNNLWDNRRSLARDDLLVLSDTLAHSLAAIHAADLVHRDVTPGNLLVRHNGLRPGRTAAPERLGLRQGPAGRLGHHLRRRHSGVRRSRAAWRDDPGRCPGRRLWGHGCAGVGRHRQPLRAVAGRSETGGHGR
jgi:serine/threonine protein kinase